MEPFVRGFGVVVLSAVFALANVTLAQPPAAPYAGSWPEFLADRTGKSSARGLIDQWPEGGPKEVWRAAGGVGMSGLAVVGSRLVTLVQKEGQQWLVALDTASGKQ